jgi:hypothetical protein
VRHRRQRRVCDFAKHQQQSDNGAIAISQSGATGLTLSISAASGGPSKRPQLRPELIVASAAILFSSPAR